MVEKRTKISNRMSDLRGIIRKATEQYRDLRCGQYYEGKAQDLDRLEKIKRDAEIEYLELELRNKSI
jgi:hypothetical protein